MDDDANADRWNWPLKTRITKSSRFLACFGDNYEERSPKSLLVGLDRPNEGQQVSDCEVIYTIS